MSDNDLVKRLRGMDGDSMSIKTLDEAADRIEELEAKLAKAVEALEVFSDDRNWFDVRDAGADPYDGRMYAAWRGPADEPEEFARTTLAELKEETDE
jgi:hypothetical protein